MIPPSPVRSFAACTTREADLAALFVYGTLRRSVGGPAADTHFHARTAEGISSASSATLRGAQLYDLGSYPGIGRGDAVVLGEVFEVSSAALETADEIEGHPDFYVRAIETVMVDDGSECDAWVYWTPQRLLTNSLTIPTGDWFDRPRDRVVSATMNDQLAHDKTRVALENS